MSKLPTFYGPSAKTQELETLRARVVELERERDEARRDHANACALVAQMHAAAVGEVRGPTIGVVEDVAALAREVAELRRVLTDALDWLDKMKAHDPAQQPGGAESSFYLLRGCAGEAAKDLRAALAEQGQTEPRCTCESPSGGAGRCANCYLPAPGEGER